MGAGVAGRVELGEFSGRAGEADLEAFDLAVPAFVSCLGYPGLEVVADLLQSWALDGVWAQERTSDVPLTELTRRRSGSSRG